MRKSSDPRIPQIPKPLESPQALAFQDRAPRNIYILQRGVQWKQGVVNYLILYTILLYNTTPIHCTPDPLHPPLQNIHNTTLFVCGGARRAREGQPTSPTLRQHVESQSTKILISKES